MTLWFGAPCVGGVVGAGAPPKGLRGCAPVTGSMNIDMMASYWAGRLAAS